MKETIKEWLTKLSELENTPVTLIVLGFISFILAAGGGLKVDGLTMPINEDRWRITLALTGALAAIGGVFLYLRTSSVDAYIKKYAKRYDIKFHSPKTGDVRGGRFEVSGTCKRKPDKCEV